MHACRCSCRCHKTILATRAADKEQGEPHSSPVALASPSIPNIFRTRREQVPIILVRTSTAVLLTAPKGKERCCRTVSLFSPAAMERVGDTSLDTQLPPTPTCSTAAVVRAVAAMATSPQKLQRQRPPRKKKKIPRELRAATRTCNAGTLYDTHSSINYLCAICL